MSAGVDTALRVTVIGGGNGISAVLRGLAAWKAAGTDLDIRAVVATSDDGGSSGRLRRQRGGLPYGDLRNCLHALAGDHHRPAARLFSHRFGGSGELAGHALGNLMLAALAEQEGCSLRALDRAGELLGACGRVLPATLANVSLEGETVDGRRISGESELGNAGCALRRVWLDPETVLPAPGVLDAIREAELLVIGPGSLFTSLLAVLAVRGVAEAVRTSPARRVLISNLMTQPGETLGMDLEAHLRALDTHVGPGLVEDVLYEPGPLPDERLRPYRALRAEPLRAADSWNRSERLVAARLASDAGKIRHDPERLVDALRSLSLRKRTRPTHRAEGRGSDPRPLPRIASAGEDGSR